MPPKKAEPRNTRDVGTDPPPLMGYDPFDLDGRSIMFEFQGIRHAANEALDELRKQNTAGAPKTIKDRVLNILERLTWQLGDFHETLDRSRTVGHRLQCIEHDILEIKTEMKNVPTAAAKTWAEVTATKANSTTKANEHAQKRQLREDLRQERAKYEITLMAEGSEETEKKLERMHPVEITKKCQQAIETTKEFSSESERPKLNGITKLAKNRIRLQCQSPKQKQLLCNMDWNLAFDGLRVYKPRYAIVVHGVLATDVNFETTDPTDIKKVIQELEEANSSRGLPIVKIAPLRRNPAIPRKHHSIIVFTHDPMAADACIKLGFYINGHLHNAERYAPQMHITQCYKCFQYGHRAARCTRKQHCGKCAKENHSDVECTTSTPHSRLCCTLCKGDHHPWDVTCPEREAEGRRLRGLRAQMSPYFTS